MKERPLANCERDFLLQLIERNKRLGGRRAYDYRNIKISFGSGYGCCHVNLGDTQVMAQVTSSLVEPKQTRPNEGTLMINIEFNHVACPGYEPGRLSRIGVQINRLLERCIKECKCVDLESLCVIAEKQVVFAGIEGCYNIDILSPLEFKTGLLMVNDSIHFGQHCSMEYLTKHYSQIRKELLNAPEPLFFVNDERLLTSLLPSTENQHRLGNELDKLKDWMEPSSKLVTFICDPVSRLILYVQKMLVLMEPTKEAVHKFVTRRLNKAKTCLSRHGAEECQQLDKKDDILYSFILQGIYYPYMVKLPKHISSDLIKAVYIDQTNASSYDVTMKRLAETLSVSIHDGRKNKCKEHQIEEAKNFNTLLTNMHPVTLAAIRKFYKPFQNDVWEVRVDVKVLNHSGNILDACSLAAITALAHFKRPDVTVDDGKVIIHPEDEKSYIPLSVHHMPICTSFSFFHSGKYLLLDATYEEERVMEGQMMIAMNKHREICALHMNGTHLLHKDQVARCTNITAAKVIQLTELINRALQNDKESRDRGDGPSSAKLNTNSKVDKLTKQMEKSIKFKPDQERESSSDELAEGDSDGQVVEGSESDEQVVAGGDNAMDTVSDEQWNSEKVKLEGKQTRPDTEIGSGGLSAWNMLDQEEDQGVSEQTKMIARKRKHRGKKEAKSRHSDSEEEETVTLQTCG